MHYIHYNNDISPIFFKKKVFNLILISLSLGIKSSPCGKTSQQRYKFHANNGNNNVMSQFIRQFFQTELKISLIQYVKYLSRVILTITCSKNRCYKLY